ncbi:hypothetical protein [Burkholderia ambifaria]|uniref:hypothetical protein n=1 Tax=Burkholderia ambifaria TaxID=152480 RepID=UPI002FE02D14
MDAFRPTREPARSIYDAIVHEAAQRRTRRVNAWAVAERAAVFHEAVSQARILGIREPTMAEVEREERLAMGHSDFASKWANGVAQLMLR